MSPITPLFDRKKTLTILVLATLAVMAVLPLAAAQAVTVQTDKDVYALGETMIISVTAAPGASVSIQVFNPQDTQCFINQNATDAQGNYQTTMVFPSEPTSLYPLGTYTVRVYSAGETAEKTVELASEVPPPPPPTVGPIDVSIDVGAFYFPGETATFHILTTISGVPASVAAVTSNLYLPDGTKVPLTPETVDVGLYKVEYELPADASKGSYTLVVQASQGDYQASAVKSFQVSTTLSDINAKLVALEGTVATLQTDVGTVKTDVDAINLRVSDISQDIALIKTDVGTIKGKVESTVKVDISNLKSSVDATKSSVEGIPDLISGVTTPIWIAVILSLIAAIAAIVSVIQISRKIAS